MKTLIRLAAVVALLAVTSSVFAQPQNRRGKGRGSKSGRETLKVGAEAPDFKLKTVDGKKEVKLASFKGKRPVVLVFGSYT